MKPEIRNLMETTNLSHYVTCVFCHGVEHNIFQTGLEELKIKNGEEIAIELAQHLSNKGWTAAKIKGAEEEGYFPCCEECSDKNSLLKSGRVETPIRIKELIP